MKNKIKDEVYKLSNTHGIKKLTMSEIATSLRISKKTIYEYFQSKDELINEVIDDYINNNYEILNKELEKSNNIIEQLKIACFLFSPTPYDFYENNIEDIKSFYSDKYLEIQTLIEYKTNRIIEIYRNGIELGIFESKINPITIAFISQSFVNMTNDSEKPLHMCESKKTLFESFYEILLYGCTKR
ncbi:TetR/AcrR family transcriptional regulator [Brassicibacter mesophilus]|uniref:TetR/AcrR family transcriptional regulator n=1 Tax=Brassicibacter mesophilus TaxID=745119 RepID=UPI003D1F133C